MKILIFAGASLAALTLLAGCDISQNVPAGEPRMMAIGNDTAIVNVGGLPQREAAIAYDPDGCQNWIIDDGAEGYASRRRDPVSGMPVCNKLVKPGYVVGNPRTNTFTDILPE